MKIDIEVDRVDVEAIKGQTRILCPWGTPRIWVGLTTHRLDGLVQACLFSPPSHLFQMEARGSKGKHTSAYVDWGAYAGTVLNEQETRNHYLKRYSIIDEPIIDIRSLRGQFHLHSVRDPVVHYIYVKRGSPPMYMLWCFTHTFRRNFAISDNDAQAIQTIARDYYEQNFTFDVYAASEIKLGDEDLETAILNAHSWDYIYDNIRPAIMTHSQPSVFARLEYPEAPKVVSNIAPLRAWTRNTF